MRRGQMRCAGRLAVLDGHRSHVLIELRSSRQGCFAKARIEGTPDGLARTFVGVLGSRDEAVSEATSWALGWLKALKGRTL
jgi:hypothetical protein